jgi:hypothetical protein
MAAFANAGTDEVGVILDQVENGTEYIFPDATSTPRKSRPEGLGSPIGVEQAAGLELEGELQTHPTADSSSAGEILNSSSDPVNEMASTKGIGILYPALYSKLCVNLNFADANELRVASVTARRIVDTKDNDGRWRDRWRIEKKAADAKRRVAEAELRASKERVHKRAEHQARVVEERRRITEMDSMNARGGGSGGGGSGTFYKGGQFTPGGGRAPAGGVVMPSAPAQSSISRGSGGGGGGGGKFYKGGQFMPGGGRAPAGGARRR